MKRKLFGILALMGALSFGYGQEACNMGTTSDNYGMGENVSTGGLYEYNGAVDFSVPFGTIFTTGQITVNLLKGQTDLEYVNVSFLEEDGGMPGAVIEEFPELTPVSSELVYNIDGESFSVYKLTINLPENVVFEKGKYFLQISAKPGDDNGAWWERTANEQRYGVFDFIQIFDEPWGGTGYYNKVFQVIGTCEDSGEVQPEMGEACSQGNVTEFPVDGVPFIANSEIISVADDFIVPENTTFHLTHFTMNAWLLGGGLHNATINIRSSENGMPGAILHSFENKGPEYEQFNDYWPVPGQAFDAASIIIDFSFEFAPIELAAGAYFIDVRPTPNASELLTWEATPAPGIGSSSYVSQDQGTSWIPVEGFNQVFTVTGFCEESLGVENPISEIGVYPNPTKDILNIKSNAVVESVTIFDLNGRKVREFRNPSESISISGLSNGLYIAKIALENGAASNVKIVKE